MAMIYHRTRYDAACGIFERGFRLKKEGSSRIESGNGIYCCVHLEDANRSYCRKYYGPWVVSIEIPDDLDWEFGIKTDFMRRTKEGDDKGNRRYPSCTTGEVAVLWEIGRILSLRFSKDGGKTWVNNPKEWNNRK